MKRLSLILLLCAAPAAASVPVAVADLSWMSGDWMQEAEGKTVRETWMPPYQGSMAGVGQTHRPGKPARTEFMTITTLPGGVTFTAYVGGQPPTPFVLKPAGRARRCSRTWPTISRSASSIANATPTSAPASRGGSMGS